jgi:hypothetical protein
LSALTESVASQELYPVPTVPASAELPEDEQLGTGFFVGGTQLHHFETAPVTPRR